ncbi:hypothetical protein QYC35_07400 [Ligilactobacillus salivarius]|uniref:Uncharacterized protein n=1 Tax=Ligilactobacillus salivarius TaxID=1624 RepID=A0AAW7N7E2_9LACO|nr:hypothetical protein [Ligilactobacillus salivarius]MDN4834023.1 hypothetical protein [Ligilactobacillus salivarius]
MNENKKTKALVEELENEFPNIYDRINYGLYVLVIDENGKIYDDESEPDFNEDDIEEVQVIYNGDAVSVFPNFIGKCTFKANTVKYENLDVITRVIGIIGKHFKNWKELN